MLSATKFNCRDTNNLDVAALGSVQATSNNYKKNKSNVACCGDNAITHVSCWLFVLFFLLVVMTLLACRVFYCSYWCCFEVFDSCSILKLGRLNAFYVLLLPRRPDYSLVLIECHTRHTFLQPLLCCSCCCFCLVKYTWERSKLGQISAADSRSFAYTVTYAQRVNEFHLRLSYAPYDGQQFAYVWTSQLVCVIVCELLQW